MSEKGRKNSNDSQWCDHASQQTSKNHQLSPLDPKWCPDAFKLEILERTEEGMIQEIAERLSLSKDKMWRITNPICEERQKEWYWMADYLVWQEVQSGLLKQAWAKPDIDRENALNCWKDRCDNT